MKLNECVKLVIDYRGKTPLKLGMNWVDNGEFRALSAKNIKTGKIVQPESVYRGDFLLYKTWMKDEVERNDILITSEAPFGEVFYWNSDEKIILSQRLYCLRPNKEVIIPKYLYYCMCSAKFQSELKSRATGSTAMGLRQPELLACNILKKSISEQQHIVNTIGSVDDLIENYNFQIKKINDILEKSLLVYQHKCMIAEYNPNVTKSGINKFDNKKIYLDTSSVEGINNISNGEIITYLKRPSRANMQPEGNSVWFAKMKGSNKIIVITNNDHDLIDKHILSTGYLGIKESEMLPLSLLTAIMISKDFNIQRDLNSVGTTMAGVNNETFLKILVPKLTYEEVVEYDRKYRPFVLQLSILRKKINSLIEIKRILLDKYF